MISVSAMGNPYVDYILRTHAALSLSHDRCLSPYPNRHCADFRRIHRAGHSGTIEFPLPQLNTMQESNHVSGLETVGGPGSQREVPAASIPWRLRVQCCISHRVQSE